MQKIRIWVDGQCFQTASNVRGIGRYVFELLSAISHNSRVQLVISLNASMREEAVAARQFLEITLPRAEIHVWFGTESDPERVHGYSPKHHANGRLLIDHINNLNVDVALSPSPFEGLDDKSNPLIDLKGLSCPSVCIFHDAIPHRFPERYMYSPVWNKAYYRRLFSINRFDLILTNSNFTANEVSDILERDDAICIGAGLSKSFLDAAKIPDSLVEMPFNLPQDYVLCVGGLDWRKNIPSLISAMALLPQAQQGWLGLVIIGSGAVGDLEGLRGLWTSLGLPDERLLTPGNVTDAQLVKCYRHARVAVQPSLMEGFGLTALEAMALGCPFLASSGGAVEEVLGNPEQVFDGKNPQELARLVGKVLTQPEFTGGVIAAGKKRLPLFEWSHSAQIAMTAIETLLAEKGKDRQQDDVVPAISPRIVMDVTSTTLSPAHTGIQRVIRRLSGAMVSRGDVPTVLSFSDDYSGWYGVKEAYPHAVSHSPMDRLNSGPDDVYFMLDSSWDISHFHKPRIVEALTMGQKVVHGVHDIGPLTMPAMTDAGMPPCFANWFRFILGHSTAIICVSRATADEVDMMIRAIRLPRPMKIGYVQLGSDFTEGSADESWLDEGGNDPFFLMVGTIEPRKGHALVLDAFDQYWASGGKAGLVLIGKPGWNTRLLELRLQNHPELGKRLRVHANVSDAQLRGAYARAHALIMASYLEGFGLPVVEAGRLGCPVILSDIPVFREVAQGAAYADFFVSGDVDSLLMTIVKSLALGSRVKKSMAVAWPDWHGTAQQVQDIIFGEKWYKTYEPAQIAPNIVPDNIGDIRMRAALSEKDQACAMRYVDGPLLSEDGDSVQISVAIRNEGSVVWSSNPPDGLQINVASHIIDHNGELMDAENPRAGIPFAMPPQHEMVFPIRVSTDWLARGGHYVDVVMVQEGVSRFGTMPRFSLNQRPAASDNPATNSFDQIRLDVLRQPWKVPGLPGYHILIAVTNIGAKAISTTADNLKSQISVSYNGVVDGDGKPFSIASAFDLIPSGQVGLMTITTPEDVTQLANSMRVKLGDGDSGVIHIMI